MWAVWEFPLIDKNTTGNQLEWSVCSCLTQLILFDSRGVFALLPKVQLHVSALDISHLQVVHESLESSYIRFNMGCIQWGCGGCGGHEISYVSYYVTYILCLWDRASSL